MCLSISSLGKSNIWMPSRIRKRKKSAAYVDMPLSGIPSRSAPRLRRVRTFSGNCALIAASRGVSRP